MFRYVIYVKNSESQKKGDICLYPENICEELVKKRLVKYYEPKEEV